MNRRNILLLILLLLQRLPADKLAIEPQGMLQKNVPVRFTLTLEQPAEAASIEFSRRKQPFFLNQVCRLPLAATGNPGVFTAQVIPLDFFHPALFSGSPEQDAGDLEVNGIVLRSGQEFTLPAVRPWEKIQPGVVLQKANQVLSGYGKFGQAACFDGMSAIGSVNRMPFHPESGTLEAWVFLPPLLPKQTGIIAFLQSADGSPWRYHALQIPADSRKIQYFNYSGSSNPAWQSITSREIDLEEWIFVSLTWSLESGRMEMFVNGESAGSAPYLQPSGGSLADLHLGARIHFANRKYQIISACLLMLDDLRISRVVRPTGVPERELQSDADTLLLLHFDGREYLAR